MCQQAITAGLRHRHVGDGGGVRVGGVAAPRAHLLPAEEDAGHRGARPAAAAPAGRHVPAPGRQRAAAPAPRHRHALQHRRLD